MRITSAKQARQFIGKTVYWDFAFGYSTGLTRSGIVKDVSGRNILIDSDWKWMPDLANLRDCETA